MKQVYINFFASLILFCVLGFNAWAYDFKVDGVAYNITSTEEKTVEVTAGDNKVFYHDDVVIPPTVTYDGITYTVTAIGNNAFFKNTLTSISLPNTLRIIMDHAFYYCHQLKSLVIPEGVEIIKHWAINDCDQLESVYLPSTLVEFGNMNFGYCPKLSTVVVAPGNPKYDSRENCNAVIETETNTLYRGSCGWSRIPSGIREISDDFLLYISSFVQIDSLYIPESVYKIGRSRIYADKVYVKDWESLCGINYHNGITYLTYGVIIDKDKLFIDGKLLEGDVTLPDINGSIDMLRGYDRIYSLHIPSYKNSVPHLAFAGCSNLATITFDEGATLIEGGAFKDCSSLKTVKLPVSMKEIGDEAFSKCTMLRSFRFPSKIKTIGSNIFKDCPKLVNIIVDAQKPPTINYETFSEDIYKNVSLFVPKGKKSSYESAEYWKNFDHIIDDEEPNENLNMLFEVDNLYYHVTSVEDMEVEVVSYFDYFRYPSYDANFFEEIEDKETTEIVIPAKVTDKDNGLSFTVTRMTTLYSTEQFVNAQSIRIPSTIREIYFRAFPKNLDIKIDDLSSWCKISFTGGSTVSMIGMIGNDHNIHGEYVGRNLYVKDQLVTDLIIPDGVTSINDMAFYNFKSLKSVTFAPSVKHIGTMAFDHSSLEKVVIPSTIERIGTRAFSGCFDLKELTIENGLSEIGIAAFSDCLDLPNVTIPASVKRINNFAFRCCKNLKDVTFAEGIQEIGEWSFAMCENLETISIPRNIAAIGRHAFNGCISLKSIQLAEGLESIDHYAFTNCTALESLHIPASVNFIGRNVVEDCPKLKSITVDSGNTIYDSRNGGDVIYETSTNTIVAVAPEAEIPQGVDTIGEYAFAYLSDRQSVILPEGVKVLGDYAFLHCWSLHTITFPASVTKIGHGAFDLCEAFESVVAMSEDPCQMDNESFTPGTYSRAVLYVPDGAEEKYRNADGWKNFAKIEGHKAWQSGIKPIIGLSTGDLVIKVERHRISLSNLEANELIRVYRMDGALVKSVKAAPDGKAILMLPEGGLYVIRTESTVKKVTL